MIIGNREYDLENKTYIMGILNVTPDSFYDGNRYDSMDKALAHTEKMVSEGADIIDIGGMSTRPGHSDLSCAEEIKRVAPVIREIKKRFDTPLSVDTYRSEVALEAISAGADMVNDIWGGLRDGGRMADLIAKCQIPFCLMHNDSSNVASVEDVISGLRRAVDHACAKGVDRSKIIVDPGIGFAKDARTNLRVIREIARLKELEYPIMLGASNKSFIGRALNLPEGERLEGTLAVAAYAVLQTRIAFLRVHEIRENARVVRMLAEIANA